MTKEEEARLIEARKKNPQAGRIALVKATGVTEAKVKMWLRGKVKVAPATTAAPHPIQKGIAVKAFLHKLDYPAQIEKAVKLHCRDAFLPENELRVLTGLNTTAFSIGKNSGMFAENTFKQDNIVYWSTAKNVAEAKKMRGIQ